MRFFNGNDSFFFGIGFDWNSESPFVGAYSANLSVFPPVEGNFLLLNGTQFLLLNSTNFLLL